LVAISKEGDSSIEKSQNQGHKVSKSSKTLDLSFRGKSEYRYLESKKQLDFRFHLNDQDHKNHVFLPVDM
jgi:hypothetical protein